MAAKRFIVSFFGWKHGRKLELTEPVQMDKPPVVRETKYEDWVEVFRDGEPLFVVRKDLYTHYDSIDLGERE